MVVTSDANNSLGGAVISATERALSEPGFEPGKNLFPVYSLKATKFIAIGLVH